MAFGKASPSLEWTRQRIRVGLRHDVRFRAVISGQVRDAQSTVGREGIESG